MIRNALAGIDLPVYGDGKNIRDWLFVNDHCRAIDLVFQQGESGRSYCVGGENEVMNIDLVRKLCDILGELRPGRDYHKLITFVKDRPGHDRRYAIDSSYIRKSLGWHPEVSWEEGLKRTVEWYLANEEWLQKCTSGEYLKYYDTMYKER
jgi:dTDP-glucose 4,6-dehydratase